jgi:UDP-glucose 4-epimerase
MLNKGNTLTKYLVTGSSGFMGSLLVEALASTGNKVNALAPRPSTHQFSAPENINLIEGSTTDRAIMELAFDGVDACFHLAGVALDHDPRHDRSGAGVDNSGYVPVLFNAARQAGNIPIIYASSAAVYGLQPGGPIQESASTKPVNAHGEEKLRLEEEANIAFEKFGTPSISLRFFNVYGPTQSLRSLYCGAPRRFVEFLKSNQPIPLYGGGHQIRDFTHVNDAVESMLRVIDNPISGASKVNIGTGVGVSIRDVANILSTLSGVKIVLEDLPIGSTDVKESVADASLAERNYGFRSRITLEDGLQQMIDALL